MIVKLLARDVRFGLPFLTFSLLAAPLLGVLFSIGSAGDIVYAGESLSAYTLGDFLAIAFNFSVPLDLWNLIQGRPLSITFSWFFPMAVMLSSLLEYPRADAFGAGYRAVLASGSRWAWWIAKCLWACLAVCVFWLLFLASFTAVAGAFGVPLSLSVTQEGLSFIRSELSPSMVGMTMLPLIALLVPVCCALALVQLAVSLLLDGMFGYVLSMGLLFASSMVYHPLLIGNYLISGRSPGVFPDAFGTNEGLALAILMAWAAVAIGGLLVSRMTIYGGARDG